MQLKVYSLCPSDAFQNHVWGSLEQNGSQFAEDIFNLILLTEIFVHKYSMENKSTLIQEIASHLKGSKLLPAPTFKLINTRPQWVISTSVGPFFTDKD